MEACARRVPGAHGITLNVLEWSTQGVPFLMVHGFGNEAHVWDDVATILAPHYRTLALDLRGHGDSDADPEARYGLDEHVADLESATRALDVGRMVLMGHSLGGRIALLFAAAYPERMAGLVLVDSGPEHDARGSLRIRLDVGRSGDPSFASLEAYRAALASAYPAAAPATLDRLARFGARRREDGRFVPKLDPALRRLVRSSGERDSSDGSLASRLWSALRCVPCPALVVRGAASDVFDADTADRMVEEALAQGRLAVVPRAGHSVMIDNPADFGRAIADFALGDA